MLKKNVDICAHILPAVTLVLLLATLSGAQPGASYMYNLSSFSGPVSSMWARITVDSQSGEIYTLNRQNKLIEVFNEAAMQVYGFGEGLNLASAADITSTEDGELFILYRSPVGTVRHFNYRGESLGVLRFARLADGQPFQPDLIDYQAGQLYLADSGSLQIVVASLQGDILEQYDFRARVASQMQGEGGQDNMNEAQKRQLEKDLKLLDNTGIGGFCVDVDGTIYFSLSTMFVVYRYAPDGKLEAFGVPGSAPGKFGVVASVAVDGDGNIFVSDRLRNVVLMFDHDLNFIDEFGYRGDAKGNLVIPDDIAIDPNQHRLYVAQAAKRGVSVFTIKSN